MVFICYFVNFLKCFLGLLRSKVRQLGAMGMKVIIVPWFEFNPLDRQSRLLYLEKKIIAVSSKRSKILLNKRAR